VYVCMCVCVFVCVCVCVCVCVVFVHHFYICMYTRTCTSMLTHSRTCPHMYTHILHRFCLPPPEVYVYIFARTPVRVCIYKVVHRFRVFTSPFVCKSANKSTRSTTLFDHPHTVQYKSKKTTKCDGSAYPHLSGLTWKFKKKKSLVVV